MSQVPFDVPVRYESSRLARQLSRAKQLRAEAEAAQEEPDSVAGRPPFAFPSSGPTAQEFRDAIEDPTGIEDTLIAGALEPFGRPSPSEVNTAELRSLSRSTGPLPPQPRQDVATPQPVLPLRTTLDRKKFFDLPPGIRQAVEAGAILTGELPPGIDPQDVSPAGNVLGAAAVLGEILIAGLEGGPIVRGVRALATTPVAKAAGLPGDQLSRAAGERAEKLSEAVAQAGKFGPGPYEVPPPITVEQSLTITRAEAVSEVASELPPNVMNLHKPPVGLTSSQRASNIARRVGNFALDRPVTGRMKRTFTLYNDVSTPVFEYQTGIRQTLGSQAEVLGSKIHSTAHSNFIMDSDGLIPGLAHVDPKMGAPGIHDVAARLKVYQPHLNDAQLQALRSIRNDLSPWRELFDIFDLPLKSRRDVMEGGFYIPRGEASEVAQDLIERVRGIPSQGGGKAGFERAERFPSYAKGISEGYKYPALGDTIKSYIGDIGERVLGVQVSEYFKGLKLPSGKPLYQTPAMRVPTGLRDNVAKLRSGIAGRVRTLGGQEGVTRTVVREAERVTALGREAGGRARAGLARLRDLSPEFVARDARRLGDELEVAIRERLHLAKEVGSNVAELRMSGKALSAEDRAITDLVSEVVNETEIGSRAVRPFDAETYTQTIENIFEVNKQIDKLLPSYERLSTQVDDLIIKGALLGDQSDDARAAHVAIRKLQRSNLAKDRSVAAAEREFAILEIEEGRAVRRAAEAELRVGKAVERQVETNTRLNAMRARLDALSDQWQEALENSRRTPEDRTAIDLAHLQGYDFPTTMANAINNQISKSGGPRGRGQDVLDTIVMINRLGLGIGATADNSGPAIQGILGAFADTKAFAGAMRVNTQAWVDERVLGSFIRQYDGEGLDGGLPTASQMAGYGVHVGGAATEMSLGQGALARVSRLPFVRNANRAFGYFGDALRLRWSRDLIEEELSRGRPLPEIIQSGDMERIAEIANNMTGWSRTTFTGSVGDLVWLAPRYLQARFDTVYKGAQGFLPGATLDKRIAKRSLLRMVAGGIALTHFANEIRGKETDWDPLVEGKWNSNFMRIKDFAGRDWTLFGPWDSFGRLLVTAGTGDPFNAVRGLTSTSVSNAFDFALNSDFEGKHTRDNLGQVAARLAKNLEPFTTEEVGGSIKQFLGAIDESDFVGMAGAAAGSIGSFFSIKSSPQSYTDLAMDAAQEIIATLPLEERRRYAGSRFHELPQRIKDQAQQHPDVQARREELPPRLASIEERVAQSHETYRAARDTARNELKPIILNNPLGGREKRLAIQAYKGRLFIASQTAYGLDDVNEHLSKKDPTNLEDRLRQGYWSVQLKVANPQTGSLDYPEFDRQRERALYEADLYPEIGRDLILRRAPIFDEILDPALAQYHEDIEAIRPYWEVEDAIIAPLRGDGRAVWTQYRNAPRATAERMRSEELLIREILDEIEDDHKIMRMEHVDIDVAMVRLGYPGIPRTEEGLELLAAQEQLGSQSPITDAIPRDEPVPVGAR